MKLWISIDSDLVVKSTYKLKSHLWNIRHSNKLASMPCESCNTQFTIFKHKKSCGECRYGADKNYQRLDYQSLYLSSRRLYCVNCLQKTRRRSLCSRCVIFTKRPLTRNELGRLKPKDLIIYLQSKHIPTAGCVGESCQVF